MREVRVERNTTETQIDLTLDLDGAGIYQVDTGCGFFEPHAGTVCPARPV